MSTRCLIAREEEDGSVTSIYCHSDGYPDGGVGATLFEHYTTDEKVLALLALGDISYLDKELADTFAYGRDRGEEGTEATAYPDRDEWLKNARDWGAEWLYLLVAGSGSWLFAKRSDAAQMRAMRKQDTEE